MKKILITGGYGEVGSLIAGELIRDKWEIVIAGRDFNKAKRMAGELGGMATPVKIDINNPVDIHPALKGVSLVINCVDQTEPFHLVKETIANGIDYLDITPHEAFIRAALKLAPEAVKSGACALLCAGLVPGIANVMARSGAQRVENVDEIKTSVLLGIGDTFGSAAVDYMLDVIPRPFQIIDKGQKREVRILTESTYSKFHPPINNRRVYRYNLPDQFFYPETLKAETAGTYLAIEPASIMKLLTLAMRAGTGRLMRFKTFRTLFKKVFMFLQGIARGSDLWALSVEVNGSRSGCLLTLSGNSESRTTAAGAVIMARSLLVKKKCSPGVWLPEQLIDPAPFFKDLESFGLRVAVIETKHGIPE